MRHPEFTAMDSEWVEWVNRRYPFEPKWEKYLLTRDAVERDRSIRDREQLEDIRGLRDRHSAAMLAKLFFGMEAKGWQGEARPTRRRQMFNQEACGEDYDRRCGS